MPGRFVIAKSVRSFLRSLFTPACLLLMPLAAVAGTSSPANLAGVYVARTVKSAPSMTVSLGADGSATVTGDLGKGAITSFGSWQGEGQQVKITFNAEEGTPATPPMVFAVGHDQMQAVTWSSEAWGSAPPPVMQKGYKVKFLFWSATMR